jgi:hypothetical protein
VPERDWCIAAVRLSDSLHLTLGKLATELRGGVIEWRPESGAGLPSSAGALVILAGGAEPAALDLLTELHPNGVPRYVIGALADHRLATTAVQRGARDYFALPEDLDLLRRSLECEAREARGRLDAGRFAISTRSSAAALSCDRPSARPHGSPHIGTSPS